MFKPLDHTSHINTEERFNAITSRQSRPEAKTVIKERIHFFFCTKEASPDNFYSILSKHFDRKTFLIMTYDVALANNALV